MADELNLRPWCGERIVVDEVVGLLVDFVIVTGPLPWVKGGLE